MSLYCDVMADPYHWREPVARKQHTCCECNAPILKGEKHFSCWGKWEDESFARRQHLVCLEACMLIRDELNGGECVSFGGLKEAFDELKWESDKTQEPWKRLRHLMAVILWRERQARASR